MNGYLTEEPMMNILCNFENGTWRIIIFPREKQRPSHFYRNGKNRILVSPAAAELDEIEEIYGEVTLNRNDFAKLKEKAKTLRF